MEEKSTAREENLSKVLYKVILYLVKTVPMLVAFIYALNTALSYFYIDLPILTYIVHYIFLLLLYVTSYAFKFCSWHRMFIHYILIVSTLNIIDYHIGIALSDRSLYLLYIFITGASIIITVYLKFKACKH